MPTYRCLIIDDEPIAGEIIASFLARLDAFEVIDICQSAVQGFERLQREPVDLLFLDIQMPGLTGLELLRSLSRRPAVILTTAYREYALEGYELDVVDYLLKPIAFERFLQAIAKFQARRPDVRPQQPSPISSPAGSDHLFVRADRKMVRVDWGDILFLESQGDYVKIVTDQQVIVTKETLSKLEELLPSPEFLRVHRSFIVHRSRITAYTAHDIELGKWEVPIGRNYRALVERQLGGE